MKKQIKQSYDLLKTASTSAYGSYKEKYLRKERSFEITTEFNYTHFIACAFWVVLFLIVFWVPQVFEMFNDYVVGRSFPYWSHLWLLVFSINIYSFIKRGDYDNSGSEMVKKSIASISILIFPPLLFMLFILLFFLIDADSISIYNRPWDFEIVFAAAVILFSTIFYGFLVKIVWISYSEDKEKNRKLHSAIYKGSTIIGVGGLVYFAFYLNILGQSKHSIELFNLLLLFLMMWRQILFYSKYLAQGLVGIIKYVLTHIVAWVGIDDQRDNSRFTNEMTWSILSLGIILFMYFITPFGYYQFDSTGVNDTRVGLNDYFAEWVTNSPAEIDGTRENIYLVACQGGGSRAAYWSYRVLELLDEKVLDFEDNVFAISSVSGGTVGAAVYQNLRVDGQEFEKLYKTGEYDTLAQNFFGSDFVSNSFYRYAFLTSWGKFIGLKDRNEILQDDMVARYSEEFNTFSEGEIFNYDVGFPVISSVYDTLPVFVANTYNITDQKKAVISSVKIGMRDTFWYDDIIESSGFVPSLPQAVNLSEMFPFLSGSAKIQYCSKSKARRFYDGGVYENYGISTIKDIYEQIVNEREKGSFGERKIYIILITNSKDEDRSDLDENKNDNGLTSMIKAVSNSTFTSWPKREFKTLKYLTELNQDKIIEINNPGRFNLNRWISTSSMYKMDSMALDIVDTLKFDKGRISSNVEVEGDFIRMYFNTGDPSLRGKMASNLKLAYVNNFQNKNKESYTLRGFADHRGKPEDNMKLARNRAEQFLNCLVSIDSSLLDRVVIEKSIIVNSHNDPRYDFTEYQMALARRVELKVTSK